MRDRERERERERRKWITINNGLQSKKLSARIPFVEPLVVGLQGLRGLVQHLRELLHGNFVVPVVVRLRDDLLHLVVDFLHPLAVGNGRLDLLGAQLAVIVLVHLAEELGDDLV